jgi:dTDP-3-amino-2,3,6-trideoxy-4-keto-D-glucose/dTDP-3-amino-3,4,6-trideoxy-alpha-D-glucose/dTDP-2,6-dideoxy-D-kanosamine transaminase
MIQAEIDAAYREVMEKGDLILRGQLKRFEENLAAFVGTKYAVGLNSGYDALHISMIIAGVKAGDEVIVPAHTFLATASAVVNAGGTPILVDVARDYNIDVSGIEEKITPRTKAIIPVHLNGRPADMEKVMALAEKYKLIVVEDACQSLGAAFRGKKVGSFGLTGCWSFYPFKILGGYGDGGAITTNDPEAARIAALLRYNGEDRQTGEYYYHGFTCLLDNLQAAFLEVKLRHLPQWIERRRAIAARYRAGLSGIPSLILPHFPDPRKEEVFQNYVIRTSRRDALFEHLEALGVETLVHWRKPYYAHKALGMDGQPFPETESICREVISMPMNVEMSDNEVDYVVRSVRSFFLA